MVPSLALAFRRHKHHLTPATTLCYPRTARAVCSNVCTLTRSLADRLSTCLRSRIGTRSLKTTIILSLGALVAILIARSVWPSSDPDVIEHSHLDLHDDHPHLADVVHEAARPCLQDRRLARLLANLTVQNPIRSSFAAIAVSKQVPDHIDLVDRRC